MPMAAAGPGSVFTTRKVAAYGVISILSAFAVVLSAFRQRSNFYSAAVMLGRSNGCMMVLFNFGLFLTLCFGKVCQKIFFGPLRAVEIEHLYERSWYAITESLLAMTIFRDDFGTNFVILFVTLLFLKVFHWLSADRVEYMEQTPSVSRLFHFRMITVLTTLFVLDLFLVIFALEVVLLDKNRMGIMIMFASEFMIISATLWSTIAKYVINVQDARSEEPWEGKSMYVFFVDLITDFLKLMTYLTFFALILSFYGLPLNIIRDVYVTARSFFGRLRDFIKYRAATKNMDTRFPDATRQDLSVMSDGTCIICREEMVVRQEANNGANSTEANATPEAGSRPESSGSRGLNETPKKLPCGHIFHFHCLRSWLERQQSCPTCRRTVFAPPANPPQAGAGGQQGAAFGDARAGVQPVNGGPLTGNAAAGANASQTARDRLQSFLQQIQSDAQRAREQANTRSSATGTQTPASAVPSTTSAATPTVPGEATSSSTSTSATNSSSNQARSRIPVQRALINSLFGGQADRSARRGTAIDGTSRSRSAGASQRDDLVAGIVPPAPWTLKSSSQTSINIATPEASTSTSSTLPDAKSVEVSDKEKKEEDSLLRDPIDAREAARAAALRRFGISNGPNTSKSKANESASSKSSTHPSTHMKGSEDKADTTLSRVPGDPVLIPLFDATTIPNYENEFVPQLPFPLSRNGIAPSVRPSTGTGLGSMESLLQCSPEELHQMSLQNRKGLEERLRLLTRVEGAIGTLVEEMTRALSVLPEGHDIATNNDETEAAPSNHKGKGAAEGIHSIDSTH